MIARITRYIVFVLLAVALGSCKQSSVQISYEIEGMSPLDSLYSGVVIPCNIAPLNFMVPNAQKQAVLLIQVKDYTSTTPFLHGVAIPDMKEWKKIVSMAKGSSLKVTYCELTEKGWGAYPAIQIHVSADSIDPYLVYRLIPPGYEMWNEMGIYERNLETFEERAIALNRQTDHNCMNCHSFCMQDPGQMQLHVRSKHAGTLLVKDGKIQKYNTKTDQTMSSLVYPYWHPSGKFIAYSVNDTKQLFHTHHKNRIEVLDLKSDVVVFDIERNRLLTTSALFGEHTFETFPTFSPDGKCLYFCSAKEKPLPDNYDEIRYSLCRIAFDSSSCKFGNKVDTLYNAEDNLKSVSFPRVSPDGKRILFTLSDYGNFSIWHQESDLWMMDLQTNRIQCMDVLNSNSVESYHSWSSNSKWVVFSSRRDNGLYTIPYIAYIDAEGNPHKSFVLPQASGDFYARFMYSYNIPELIKGRIDVSRHDLTERILNDDVRNVSGLEVE